MIAELATGVAAVIVGGGTATKTVFVWCMLAVDPGDRRAIDLSRRLTLQLPFYLSVSNIKQDVEFFGYGPLDYVSECAEGNHYGRREKTFSQYDYTLSGLVTRESETQIRIDLIVDERGKNYVIPFEPLFVEDREELGADFLKIVAERIAADFEERLGSG